MERVSKLGDRLIGRRQLLIAGGVAASGLALTACAGAPAAIDAAPEVFNPAVGSWLLDLAKMVGADIIEKVFEGGLEKLMPGWASRISDLLPAAVGLGRVYYDDQSCAHRLPPTALIKVNAADEFNPLTDHMVAAVQAGAHLIVFPPWAWQAISMYAQDLTHGRSGNDLAAYQKLAVLALLPALPPRSGQSATGAVAWMAYSARAGVVEIDRIANSDGTYSARVMVEGIPDANQRPSVKSFTLPTAAA